MGSKLTLNSGLRRGNKCGKHTYIEYTVQNKENTHLYTHMFAWWDKNTQTQTSVMGSTGGLADAARSAGKQTNAFVFSKLTNEQPSQSQIILRRQVFTSFHHNLCLQSVSCAPKTNMTIISHQYQDIAELEDQVQTSTKEKKH